MTTDIPEVVGFATHHAEPMLLPNRKEAAAYCDDGEDPVALIRLSDYEKLARYYKNGIDCFANPCERHSGERTPPFSEFFEKYGGQCLICVVDNNKALQAECEELRNLLRHAQPIIRAHAEASHMLEGFRPRRNQWDELVDGIDAAIQEENRGR